VSDGEPGAEDLFERHHESLRRYLVRLTGDPDLAADLAQEAFVRLLDRRRPPASARPWLYRVATNLVRDAGRRTRRHRVLGMEGRAGLAHGDPPPATDRAADRAEARRLVRSALEALSPKERRAVLMREEGLAHREIAVALGTTTGSVGTLLRRALAKAADRLQTAEEAR
jgi:RNA polymerase sigma-70 factor (ECF subfamily)